MFVRDGRTLPFIPVTIAALRAIRTATPKRRPYAIAAYMAILELANQDRADRTAVTQKQLTEISGMSRTTLQAALEDLAVAGVLLVRERTHGRGQLENEYVVVEPCAESCTPARVAGDPHPSHGHPARAHVPSAVKAVEEDLEPPLPPASGGSQSDPAPERPASNRERGIDAWREAVDAWGARHFPNALVGAVRTCVADLGGTPSADEVRAYAVRRGEAWIGSLDPPLT